MRYPFEVYAGPKAAADIGRANPDYADKSKLYYQLAQSADQSCFCTFLWLEELMVWLLAQDPLRRAELRRRDHHPGDHRPQAAAPAERLAAEVDVPHAGVDGQASSPRSEAIKERYANDKVKQNQETMKLFAEEGVNPAAQVRLVPPAVHPDADPGRAVDRAQHRREPAAGPLRRVVDHRPVRARRPGPFNPPVTVPILGQHPAHRRRLQQRRRRSI